MFPSIHLGFADIPTYSTIFLAGFFIAIVIARKIAGRYRLAKEDVLYGAIYAAIGILIGSKLLYCLTRLPSLIQKWDAVAAGFDKNFMQTLLFLMNYLFGGLVFYGGLIGAFLGIFCYCKQSFILCSVYGCVCTIDSICSRYRKNWMLLFRVLLWH